MTLSPQSQFIQRFGQFEVDLPAAEVRKSGRRVRLQPLHFKLLTILLERPREVIGREELEERLWPGVAVGPGSLGEAVHKLRQKLGDDATTPRYIETVPRMGYKFIAQLEPAPVAEEQDAPEPDHESRPPRTAPKARLRWRRLVLPGGLALVALLAGIAADRFVFDTGPEASTGQVRQFSIRPALPLYLTFSSSRMVSVSPNGRYIAYVTQSETGETGAAWLWIHDLQRDRSRRIEGVGVAKSPFWSADSQFVVFGGAAAPGDDWSLMKVPPIAGPVSTICALPGGLRQGSIGDDGAIFIHAGSPGQAWTVPLSGGSLQPVFTEEEKAEILPDTPETKLDVGWFPQAMPTIGGHRGLVFGVWANRRMYAMDLAVRRVQSLGQGWDAFYSPTGHLLYVDPRDDLWALPFSAAGLQAEGKPFRVREKVRSPTASRDGLLVYFEATYPLRRLVWRGRNGERLGDLVQGSDGMISAKGNRVAYVGGDRPFASVEIRDLQGSGRIQVSEGDFEAMPVWSPDGTEVAVSSKRDGDAQVYVLRLDGSGQAQPLLSNPGRDFPDDWSADGRFLAYQRNEPNLFRKDLYYAARDSNTGEWTEKPLRRTKFNEARARFSPDGRYYAYRSDETGRDEIIVREFPDGRRRWIVSQGNASRPRWSRTSGEIFYVSGGMLYAIQTSTELGFSHGEPVALFPVGPQDGDFDDVTADGRKFLFAEPLKQPEPQIRVVTNWYEEFRGRQKAVKSD